MADTYDIESLAALGRRYRSGRDTLKDIKPMLDPEIVAAVAAGVPRATVAQLAGVSRERVRQIVTAAAKTPTKTGGPPEVATSTKVA